MPQSSARLFQRLSISVKFRNGFPCWRARRAFGEAHNWKCGLENKPWEAVGFYSVITAATLLGIGDQIGRFTVRPLTLALGWVTAAAMAVAALAMLVV